MLVVGIDISTSELEPLLESHSNRLSIVKGNISSRPTSERAITEALDRGRKLDSIILNAAILKPIGPAAETSVDDWKRLFDIKFFGLLHTIQIALPHLRLSDGQILMTSSGVSLTPYPAWIPYACSKAAMNWLGACLSVEEDQVMILCVTPGIVESGQQKEVRAEHRANMPPKQYKWLSELHYRGELLQPDRPASSFVHLAVHGIPLELNGQVVEWDDIRIRSNT
ncbi:hypothetical protein BKA61DRAFT_481022 [Leptodontidium sp. MPI-SDFR-AT-0119]|nr:hypothetical protein BKA61DRAFT_481022 [Leptodontidium sp. MPI-SDFR-AT-0119]